MPKNHKQMRSNRKQTRENFHRYRRTHATFLYNQAWDLSERRSSLALSRYFSIGVYGDDFQKISWNWVCYQCQLFRIIELLRIRRRIYIVTQRSMKDQTNDLTPPVPRITIARSITRIQLKPAGITWIQPNNDRSSETNNVKTSKRSMFIFNYRY